MPANNILSLLIESKTTGTGDIDNLSNALNRLAAVGEQTSRTLEGGARRTRETTEEFKKLGDQAQGTGFNLRYAFFGLKDLMEGRTKFAIAEAGNELARLKGSALALGGTVAGIAAVGIAIYEIKKHSEEAAQAPYKIAQAFRDLTRPIRESNDELEISNIKLANDIAKLEGKPENNLKLALHETALEANRLADSLDNVFDKAVKAFKEYSVGTFGFSHFMGESTTTDIDKHIQEFQRKIGEATEKGNLSIHQATARGDSAGVKTAEAEMRATVNRMLEQELVNYVYPEQSKTDALGRPHETRPGSLFVTSGEDVNKRRAYLQGYASLLQTQQEHVGAGFEHSDMEGKKDSLEALHKNTEAMNRLQSVLDRFRNAGQDGELRRLTTEYQAALREIPGTDAHAQITKAYGAAYMRELTKHNDEESKKEAERALLNFGYGQKISESSTEEFRKRLAERQPTGEPGADLALALSQGNTNVPGPPAASRQVQLEVTKTHLQAQEKLVQLAAGPGGEYETASKIAALRKQSADVEYKERQDTIKATLTEMEQRSAMYDADVLHENELYKIRMDHEEQIMALHKKEREEFQSFTVGFVNAAQSHNLPSFIKGQAQRLEDRVVSNAAGQFFDSGSGKGLFSGLHMTNDPNSTLGKLLAGTPFGAKAADPVAKAAVDTAAYTKATAAATAAIYGAMTGQTLSNLPPGVTVPGFSGAGGLSSPGLSTFGSDVNGITGSGPVSSILKSVGLGGTASGIGSLLHLFSAPGSVGSASTSDLILNGGTGQSGGIRIPGAQADAFHFANGNSSLAAGMFNGTGGANFATSAIASAGAAYAGVTSAIHDFKQGGARGIISGVGDVAGVAGAFDPEPISKSILMGIAVGSQLISSVFGDPKQIRQRDINRRLAADQFYAPVAIDATMGTNGSALSTDRYGNLQSLDASPYPQVQQSYADLRHGITVPGRSNPIGGPSGINPGPTMNVNINAIDPQSFAQFANNNKGTFADAVGAAVLHGSGENFKDNLRQAGF